MPTLTKQQLQKFFPDDPPFLLSLRHFFFTWLGIPPNVTDYILYFLSPCIPALLARLLPLLSRSQTSISEASRPAKLKSTKDDSSPASPGQRSASLRHAAVAASGLLLLWHGFGWKALPVVSVPTILSFGIMTRGPRQHAGVAVTLATFVFSICCITYPQLWPGNDWTHKKSGFGIIGIVMELTLRLSSAAFDFSDGSRLDESLKPSQRKHRLVQPPSLLEFVSYAVFFGPFMQPPAVHLRWYRDWIQKEGLYATMPALLSRQTVLAFLVSMLKSFFGLHGFILASLAFKEAEVKDLSGFSNRPLWWKALMTYAGCATIRMRQYFVWSLGEVALVLCGLGFSGWDGEEEEEGEGQKESISDGAKGEEREEKGRERRSQAVKRRGRRSERESELVRGGNLGGEEGEKERGWEKRGVALWDRAQNVFILEVELASSAVKLVTSWNRSVSHWLRCYVYERVPTNTKGSVLPLIITELVAMLWHGFNGGYLLAFSSLVFVLAGSRAIYRLQKAFANSFVVSSALRAIQGIYTLTCINYVGIGYVLAEGKTTFNVLRGLYFFGTWLPLLAVLISYLIVAPRSKEKRE